MKKVVKKEELICNLAEVLRKKKISTYMLGRYLNSNPNQLYPYVRCEKYPSLRNALAIADTLGVDLEMIWRRKTERDIQEEQKQAEQINS